MKPLACLVLLASLSAAQPAAFEVASIRPSQAEEGHESWKSNNGNLDMRNVSLRTVILAAYQIRAYEFSGPDWLQKERFDIVAKAPGINKDEDLRRLMQALLADRFQLKVHRESRSLPGYALVAGKSGLKVKPVEPGPSSSNSKRGADGQVHLTAQKVSMAKLAEILFRILDMPVVDRTGAAGVFDFTLDWAMERRPSFSAAEGGDNPPAESAGPTIFTALDERLGLKLQRDKAPVEVLVVDHCERVPAEN